jgi:hypothetical protein
MLGDIIVEGTARTVVRRVLSTEPLTIETSFEDRGKVLGIDMAGFGTFTTALRPDGTSWGEGNGVYITHEGEMVTWKGSGQGTFKENGALSVRGILYYRTMSQKLAQLNAAPGVFEAEFDREGNETAKIWEWK